MQNHFINKNSLCIIIFGLYNASVAVGIQIHAKLKQNTEFCNVNVINALIIIGRRLLFGYSTACGFKCCTTFPIQISKLLDGEDTTWNLILLGVFPRECCGFFELCHKIFSMDGGV